VRAIDSQGKSETQKSAWDKGRRSCHPRRHWNLLCNVPLNPYAFSSYPQQTVTLYNNAGGVIGSPIQYINLTQQAAESKFPFIDSAQKSGNFAPYSVGWNVELDRSFSHLMMVGVKYLQSQAHDMLTIQPEVAQNQAALVLGSTGFAQTRQLEFTARVGGQEKRQIFFSYVHQYARGVVNDANTYPGNLPFPIMNTNLVASLPSEIPNRFLLCHQHQYEGTTRYN